MGFLPSCGYVSTSIWMHHLDTNEIHEKARWELHKNATCCFEQILEAAQTAIERPPISQTIQVKQTRYTRY